MVSADPFSNLPNIGPKTASWLREAGVSSVEELRALGAVEACRHLLLAGQAVSLNCAYAIEGALRGMPWNQLPPEVVAELRDDYRRMQREEGFRP